MSNPLTPLDFPRESTPASVPGVQPKVTARLVNGCYRTGPTDEEVWERYAMCEDLAQQLAAYCQRKAAENLHWTREFSLERVERGLADKVRQGAWDVTTEEQQWVISRVRSILGGKTEKTCRVAG